MGLFSSKNKDGSIGTSFAFVDGLNTFYNGEVVELSVYEDDNEIRIRSRTDKTKPIVHLKLDKISKFEIINGIKNGKPTLTKMYIVISYNSNEEDRTLSFKIIGSSLGWNKVLMKIQNHINNRIKANNIDTNSCTDIEL